MNSLSLTVGEIVNKKTLLKKEGIPHDDYQTIFYHGTDKTIIIVDPKYNFLFHTWSTVHIIYVGTNSKTISPKIIDEIDEYLKPQNITNRKTIHLFHYIDETFEPVKYLGEFYIIGKFCTSENKFFSDINSTLMQDYKLSYAICLTEVAQTAYALENLKK